MRKVIQSSTAYPASARRGVFSSTELFDGAASDKEGDDEASNAEVKVKLQQQMQVLTYRLGLGASALLLSVQSIDDASFLDGTGINVDDVVNAVYNAHLVLPIAIGSSLALCPVPNQRLINIGSKAAGTLAVALGFTSCILPEQSILIESLWIFSLLGLMAISFREIYYFGFEYKQECGIILVMVPFMFVLNNPIPFATPLCALGLCVLAAGKVFEPLREDLIRSNSEFLAK